MALNIAEAVQRNKGDVRSVLPGDVIVTQCRQLNDRWRKRCLDPVTTTHAFLIQALHGNTACDHVPDLMGRTFRGEADCMARSQLPWELFQRLLTAIWTGLENCRPESRWRGHRVT